MGVWLQSVYISERTFSGNIFLLELSFLHGFFILYSTNRKADNLQIERTEGWMKSWLANHDADKLSGNRLLAAMSCAASGQLPSTCIPNPRKFLQRFEPPTRKQESCVHPPSHPLKNKQKTNKQTNKTHTHTHTKKKKKTHTFGKNWRLWV